MQDLTNKKHVDHLPVLVSGKGAVQLLGVPTLAKGTGRAQCDAVVALLREWGIEDCVAALCFDMTASNTGHHGGTCVLVEWSEFLDRGRFSDGYSDPEVAASDRVTVPIAETAAVQKLPLLGGMAPGAMHHARWMAKAIYSIKVWLFQKQFKLTPGERRGLASVAIFTALVYARAWTEAPFAAIAPRNDLELLKALDAFEYIDPDLAKDARNKMEGHLWYLSKELISLSLFHDKVPLETKKKIMTAIQEREGDAEHQKRPVFPSEYNRLLTKDEEQLQFLLQAIVDHRKQYPDSRKSTVARTGRQ
ncbi:hypothetical protein HAZT_HAZT010953 [Hyalella azteca]|uniref:Uncharacterized protein n=1 Tax=Hyalella azteca TaxID=294128 RepID=A0A6A0HBJ8_HYAAZ|nr:hypothetical protein HAZT_HAZT010953 [Hyalella azteca]